MVTRYVVIPLNDQTSAARVSARIYDMCTQGLECSDMAAAMYKIGADANAAHLRTTAPQKNGELCYDYDSWPTCTSIPDFSTFTTVFNSTSTTCISKDCVHSAFEKDGTPSMESIVFQGWSE